jgi:hypothetical protein
MAPSGGVLNERAMAAESNFLVEDFVMRRGTSTGYRTPDNGRPDHGRFAGAFRFVTDPQALACPTDTRPTPRSAASVCTGLPASVATSGRRLRQ